MKSKLVAYIFVEKKILFESRHLGQFTEKRGKMNRDDRLEKKKFKDLRSQDDFA